MAIKTRREREETVEFYYGINSQTFDIELVSLTRGGRLHKMGEGSSSSTHHSVDGRSPLTEIDAMWGLLDMFSFPASMCESDFVKQQLEGLRQRAVARKQEAEKGTGLSNGENIAGGHSAQKFPSLTTSKIPHVYPATKAKHLG